MDEWLDGWMDRSMDTMVFNAIAIKVRMSVDIKVFRLRIKVTKQ